MFMEFIHEVQKTGHEAGMDEEREDLMEVLEVAAGEEQTMGIMVDSMEDMAKDGMTSVVKAAEAETTTKTGIIGMGTEIKMIGETTVTTMIVEKTEENEKTNNQIDKFCPDLQSFWNNLSQKTCRGEGYPCDWPPPQQSIARKCIEKN